MTTLRQFWSRLAAFFRKRDLDRDFDEELAAHIELATEDYLRRGMSPAEARRRALVEFGGIESSKELHRDSRGLPWLDGMVQDIRFAVRSFRLSPGFSLTAIAMLAVGIGINATVFTVTDAVLFKGFPLVYKNDRLLYITPKGSNCCVSYPDFLDYRAQARSFQGMAVVHGVAILMTDNSGFTENYNATEVSSNTFQVVGQRPILGRDFAPSDEMDGAAPAAILNYAFWEVRFGKDPAILGKTVRMNGVPTTIIGVMPAGFSFPQKVDVWVPLVQTAEVLKRKNRDTWMAVGRLAEGVSIAKARAEMQVIGKRLAIAYPLTDAEHPPLVQKFDEFFIGPSAGLIYGSMFGAVAFVLLIACANLANLLLARSIVRSREISVRIALGAGRWRIIRQLLIESVVLSGLGGFLGWWLAKWCIRAYELAMAAKSSWLIVDYRMDYRVLVYLMAISVGTGLLFGLAPALRLSKLDVNATLKDGSRGATSGGRGKYLSTLLVTGEMALAVVLLAGAGVMIRSFLKLHMADVGVKTENVVTASYFLPAVRYPLPEAWISFHDRLLARLESIPGVASVAIADAVPSWPSQKRGYELAGAAPVDRRQIPQVAAVTISSSYFRTLGAALLSGREFDDSDRVSRVPTILVNQRFASSFWPQQDPLGRRIRLFNKTTPGPWLTVVGVVSNIIQDDQTRQAFRPVVYLPYGQEPEAGMHVFLRTRGTVGTALRHEVQTIDPELPIYGPSSLTRQLEGSWDGRFYGTLFLIFAAIALLLASIGLYTVIAHSVSQRTPEIGIRMAVGATAPDILKLVCMEAMLPLGIGLTVGLALSLILNRLLQSELVHVSPSDPVTLVVSSAVLICAAMFGCLIPARRAIRVDPVIALRHE